MQPFNELSEIEQATISKAHEKLQAAYEPQDQWAIPSVESYYSLMEKFRANEIPPLMANIILIAIIDSAIEQKAEADAKLN